MPQHEDLSPGIFEARIDPAQFAAILQQVKEFDPMLARSLRRNLRKAGDALVDDVRATLRSPTPGGRGARPGGVRDTLAAGTKLAIATGAKSQGIRVTTSGAKLSDAKRKMLRLYNKRTWRHPVFGDRDVWRAQQGRPYFGTVIAQHERAARQAIDDALVEAVNTVKGKT